MTLRDIAGPLTLHTLQRDGGVASSTPVLFYITCDRHMKTGWRCCCLQVGLVTFGTHVHVHELGFSECAKSYVFQVRGIVPQLLHGCSAMM